MLNRYNKHTLRVLCTNNLTEKYFLSKVLSPLTEPHPGGCFRGTAGRLKQVNFCTKHRIPFCLRKPNRLTCPIGGQKTCYIACNRIPFCRWKPQKLTCPARGQNMLYTLQQNYSPLLRLNRLTCPIGGQTCYIPQRGINPLYIAKYLAKTKFPI